MAVTAMFKSDLCRQRMLDNLAMVVMTLPENIGVLTVNVVNSIAWIPIQDLHCPPRIGNC